MITNPDDSQPLPEASALVTDNEAVTDNEVQMALDIANASRKQWNDNRKAEVEQCQRLLTDFTQDQMATEIFMAVMDHLKTVPFKVQVLVIEKFKSVNLPKVIS